MELKLLSRKFCQTIQPTHQPIDRATDRWAHREDTINNLTFIDSLVMPFLEVTLQTWIRCLNRRLENEMVTPILFSTPEKIFI